MSKMLAIIVLGVSVISTARWAESVPLSRPNSVLLNPSLLPPPKVKFPALPDNGPGIYRLTLENVFGPTALTLLIDVREGAPAAALALPLQNQRSGWWPGEVNELTCEDSELRGTISFECMPVFQQQNKEFLPGRPAHNEKNTRYEPLVLESQATATISFDAKCEGNFGSGSYHCAFDVDGRAYFGGAHIRAGQTREGEIYLVREPHSVMPGDYQCELYFMGVLANAGIIQANGRPLTPDDEFWLRVDVQGGKLNEAILYGQTEINHIRPLVMTRHSLTARDGRVDGTVEVAWPGFEDQPVTLKIESVKQIGRRLYGQITCTRGNHREATPWVGVVQTLRDTKLFVQKPGDIRWKWNQGLEPDEAMTAQAAKQALRPVMPGEPGKTGFWTWRPIDAPILMDIIDNEGQPTAVNMAEPPIVIHKRPAFTGPVATAERSWTEAALLLGRIRRGILSKPEGRGTAMARSIGAWNKNGSDHGFATSWAASTWQCLAYRALTTDPAERQWAEEMVHFNLSDVVAHLGGKLKVPYDYQHQRRRSRIGPLRLCVMRTCRRAMIASSNRRFWQVGVWSRCSARTVRLPATWAFRRGRPNNGTGAS